jgi:hypothetical protein
MISFFSFLSVFFRRITFLKKIERVLKKWRKAKSIREESVSESPGPAPVDRLGYVSKKGFSLSGEPPRIGFKKNSIEIEFLRFILCFKSFFWEFFSSNSKRAPEIEREVRMESKGFGKDLGRNVDVSVSKKKKG